MYLDIVDAFEAFERDGDRWIDYRQNKDTEQTYRQDMIDWVIRIAEHARQRAAARFFIIPQNGVQLLANKRYAQTVDGVAIESLFTLEEEVQHSDATKFCLSFLKPFALSGKTVFCIEYNQDTNVRGDVQRQVAEYGFLLLFSERSLETLGTSE